MEEIGGTPTPVAPVTQAVEQPAAPAPEAKSESQPVVNQAAADADADGSTNARNCYQNIGSTRRSSC